MVAPGWAKRRPESNGISPAAIRNRVDLPEPLRPTKQVRSPDETEIPAPASSGAVPKVRAISWSVRRGGGIASALDHHGAQLKRARFDLWQGGASSPGRSPWRKDYI